MSPGKTRQTQHSTLALTLQTRPPAHHSFESLANSPPPHVSHEAPTSKVSRVRRRRAGGAIEDKKIIRTVKCRGYAFCGERGDSSPPEEVIGVAKLEVTVKDIAMKQS